MFYVFLLYALFASVFTISKGGLLYTAPLFLMGFRMTLAGALLMGYRYFFSGETFSFKGRTWAHLLLLAFFNIYLTNALEFWGLCKLPSSQVCLLYSLSPFASALFSYFLFSESLNIQKWAGLFIGFVGFLPLFFTTTTGEEGSFSENFLPGLAVAIAAVSSVYGWILLKQLVSEHSLSPLSANGVSMLIGGICALLHSSATENWDPLPITNYPIFFECTFLLILISNFVCYNLYGSLLKKYSATFLSLAGFTTPLFTLFFGWLFLDEIPPNSFYLSLGIVFLGLLLFHREEIKKDDTKSAWQEV